MGRTAAICISIGLGLLGPGRAGAEGWLLPQAPPLAATTAGKGAVAGIVVPSQRLPPGPCGNFDRSCLDGVVAQAKRLSVADLKIFVTACDRAYIRAAQQSMIAEDLGGGSFGRDATERVPPGGAYICKNVSKILKEKSRGAPAP